jgi:Heavy metal binding domain
MKGSLLIASLLTFNLTGAIWAQDPAASATLSANPSATAVANQQYTCPMHPEVVQGKPGKCPKCGMKLVPQKSS